ncbi:Sla2p NDAI_0F03940 [Naumovozyma dairenensis CBS 421]|uniref:ENTH domain-containing protein n=1 Tax=Naumovozyma dairenensis (strain ATCC 10597 / BCRC 20456 / CBS 421 / NBRC 0211 / NRRL Y-12639) TaxID=1071378 RepID=G0WD51_NAUDC|nr:hypothetical protein NDAI_0F03940 [Naumovozyma dairenensis CBS 421]CCD25712.1 hypothetical protein NDAI_0F03940 [Naumovozyma dairenensis CBS 421]
MAPRADADLQKALKKACSIEETAPKRKHVRACIVYTWENQTAGPLFQTLKNMPFMNDEVQLFKALIVLHKIIQEGHPSALKQAIKEREWIRSLGRVHPGGASYGRLIREYVNYLVLKLDFHAHHKGFNNGVFEYEEYVSLISVADPDEGYETILDLMALQDSLDDFSQIVFASIQSDRRNAECKISSLLPLIAESYGIYKFITSMLRAMHRQLNDQEGDEALKPLEERYALQHARMFEFYADCSSIKYLTTLVTIPKLPTNPPNLAASNDDENGNGKEIKFQRIQKSPSPVKKTTSMEPSRSRSSSFAPQAPLSSSTTTNTNTNTNPMLSRNASSAFMTPMATATTAAAMIPTATAAALFATPTGAQIQPDFWATQQAQYANEQARLEQERQLQLQQQQAQQQQFQQQLQQSQNEMMQLQLQQESKHQNDLMALTTQYEKDQTLLEQYDQRVQQLENEIRTMDQNVSKQIANKDDQLISLQDQLTVWEKKYDSLAKLYSQLRQEHLQLLPKFKKLQVKVNSAQESIAQKEQLEQKLKKKDLQLIDLTKERDRARLELERTKNEKSTMDPSIVNKVNEDRLIPILDAVLETGINTIQEAIYSLDSQVSWLGPLTAPNILLSYVEDTSEKATSFATSFNDLIVDGVVEGDQISVILGVNDFSTAMANLVTNCKAFSENSLTLEKSEEMINAVKRCAREAQYFFEDLTSENLGPQDDETKTDTVINANVDVQEKLQELTVIMEPYLNAPSMNTSNNAHHELISTAETITKSSQQLRADIDVNVPKPLLSLALAIIDSVLGLIQAAIACQNEIGSNSTTQLNQFYKKNSRWTEGLISAAKAVGATTNMLITTAGKLTSGEGGEASPEEFIVASKEVAASTVQLVAASRVKTHAHSKAQVKLEDCSKDVGNACKSLVSHVMKGVDDTFSKEMKPIDFTSEHTVKTAEMEQQVDILRLEQSLSAARKRLGEIRKHAYYNSDDFQ